VLPLPNLDFPMSITTLDENSLLLVGDYGIALYDKQRKMVVNTREFDFKVTAVSRYNNLPLLFDDKGRQHLVRDFQELETTDVPFKGRVTAFASSKDTKQRAYGMSDGTIWLKDKNGRIQKLVGHRSRISKMKMNGRRLISSSYDGSVNLWISDSEKIEPMTLLQTNNWIMNFQLDSTKETVWMCDAKGNLTAVNISINKMVDAMKKKLKRNLTTEEWNYYIGPNVPYEKFVEK
jgi:WD40 repeat protein